MAKILRTFSDAEIDIIKRVINDTRSIRQNQGPRDELLSGERDEESSPDVYVAKLPPSGIPARVGEQPGYADCEIYRVLHVEANPSFLKIITADKRVYNLSSSTITEDWAVVMRSKTGEWVVSSAGGGGASEGCCECPCECLGTGDLVVQDVLTVSQFQITVDTLEFRQENGVVILPAGTYMVYWDDFVGKWMLDIGDELEAIYNDGTDATAESVLEGTIVLEYAGEESYVRVCIDAVIGPTTGTGTGTGVIIAPPGTPGNPGGEVCVPGGDIYCPQFLAAFNYGYENGAIDGFQNNPYDDRVVFAGPSGTAAGTGDNQEFGTGTLLAPGTGTYGPGTGSGSGTAPWSDEEEAFYQGYKSGYAEGFSYGESIRTAEPYGTGSSYNYEYYIGTGSGSGSI